MADEISGGRSQPPRWGTITLCLAAVGVVLAVLALSHGPRRSSDNRDTRSTANPSLSTSGSSTWGWSGFAITASPDAPAPPPIVTHAGHPILGATAPWSIAVRTPTSVIRIDMASGLVTTTAVPALDSGGPVFFLTSGDTAIVRPLDLVRGYSVRPGRPAAQLARSLGRGGTLLPGPVPGELWVAEQETESPQYDLIDQRGHRLATTGPLPSWPGPVADDFGGVLSPLGTVWYDVDPRGRRTLVTTGALLGVGRTAYVIRECRPSCRTVVVGRDARSGRPTAARHPIAALRGGSLPLDVGLVSPDGRHLAMLYGESRSAAALHVVDLRNGRTLSRPHAIDLSANGLAALAFSPDGRWLLAVDAGGRLVAIDPSTGRPRPIGIRLPPLLQVAVYG